MEEIPTPTPDPVDPEQIIEPLDVDAAIAAFTDADARLATIIDNARAERAAVNNWAKAEHERITTEAEAKRQALSATISQALAERQKIGRFINASKPRQRKPKAEAKKGK